VRLFLKPAFLYEDFVGAFYPGPDYGKKCLSARFTSGTWLNVVQGFIPHVLGGFDFVPWRSDKNFL
jgi:hypothetical protein